MKAVVYQGPIQYRRGKCARPGAASPQRWHREDHFLLYLWLGLAHVTRGGRQRCPATRPDRGGEPAKVVDAEHRRLQLLPLPLVKRGGEPPDCSNIRAAGPPSPKADAHRPMVCGSRSSASAVQPWASSQTAYHRSRGVGVGARIIRRRKALASISHCSKSRCISLAPITNPSLTPGKANSAPSPIHPMFLRISPWLWFRKLGIYRDTVRIYIDAESPPTRGTPATPPAPASDTITD